MKKYSGLKALVMVILLGLTLVSCKKDETETPEPVVKANQITYKGSSYVIDKGAYVYFTQKSQGYYSSLIFLSPGGQFMTSGETIDSLSGNGTGIAFQCITSDSTALPTGNYPYDTTGITTVNTFSGAMMVLNYDFAADIGEEVEITGGTLSVTKSSGTYEINYSGKDLEGNPLTFYFKGQMPRYRTLW